MSILPSMVLSSAFFTKFMRTCIRRRSSPINFSGIKVVVLPPSEGASSKRCSRLLTECQHNVTRDISAVGVNMRQTMLNVLLGQNGIRDRVNTSSLICWKSSRSFTKLYRCNSWYIISAVYLSAESYFLSPTFLSPLMNVPTYSTKKMIILRGVCMLWLTIAVYF